MPELEQGLRTKALIEKAAAKVSDSSEGQVLPVVKSPTHRLENRGGSPSTTEPLFGGQADSVNMKQYPAIPGYEIIDVLGQGGMGIVYRAVQTKLDRVVALKVLPALMATANPSSVSRFRREATSAARLHHTNIVPVHDFGTAREGHYYAMELVEGCSLDSIIPRLAKQNAESLSAVRLSQVLQAIVTGICLRHK